MKHLDPFDGIRPHACAREFTSELFELLWVLERTTEEYSKQKQLLDAVLEGDPFKASELSAVPDAAREAPKVARGHANQEQLGLDED